MPSSGAIYGSKVDTITGLVFAVMITVIIAVLWAYGTAIVMTDFLLLSEISDNHYYRQKNVIGNY